MVITIKTIYVVIINMCKYQLPQMTVKKKQTGNTNLALVFGSGDARWSYICGFLDLYLLKFFWIFRFIFVEVFWPLQWL